MAQAVGWNGRRRWPLKIIDWGIDDDRIQSQPLAGPALGRTEEGDRIGFRAAGSEDDLVRIRPNHPSQLLSGVLEHGTGGASPGVQRGRVADQSSVRCQRRQCFHA